MAMRPSCARILVAAAAIAAVLAPGGVDATPETTCRAAAEADRRVDYGFCVSKLSQHHDSPDADTWGLAKVAADVGVLIAGNGVYDIKAMLAGKAPVPAAGGKQAARGPLERCEALYDRMGSAFAEAYDGIDRRDYAAGKEKALEAASFARRCGDAFARAGVVPSPLAKQGADSVQMAIICTAVTNLIK
jgi:pectinesterase inhibitor-like protein